MTTGNCCRASIGMGVAWVKIAQLLYAGRVTLTALLPFSLPVVVMT